MLYFSFLFFAFFCFPLLCVRLQAEVRLNGTSAYKSTAEGTCVLHDVAQRTVERYRACVGAVGVVRQEDNILPYRVRAKHC